MTERNHGNIAHFLEGILPCDMSVRVPTTIATPDGKAARRALATSQFPLLKDSKNQDVYNRDIVLGMQSLLAEVGDRDNDCPSEILLLSVDAHCETVALSLADHVLEILANESTKTKQTTILPRTFFDQVHRAFALELASLDTVSQVKAIMKYEAKRLHEANSNGTGWTSSLHQEAMWAQHCDPLKQPGFPLCDVDLGCGKDFQQSFLLGTMKFSSILTKCAKYSRDNSKLVVLPCYVLMYVFHSEDLDETDFNSNPLEHSACYSCHCVALLIDGKRNSVYVIDGNGSIVPGILELRHFCVNPVCCVLMRKDDS